MLFRSIFISKEQSYSMSDSLVGYSVNDFFYEKSDYCIKKPDGTYNGENLKVSNLDTANENKNTTNIKTLCATNEKYGKLITKSKNGLATTTNRYEYTLAMYNRELLRTINYVVGVGMLAAYIYFNKK